LAFLFFETSPTMIHFSAFCCGCVRINVNNQTTRNSHALEQRAVLSVRCFSSHHCCCGSQGA